MRNMGKSENSKKWLDYWKKHDDRFEERHQQYAVDPSQYDRDWNEWLGDLHGQFEGEQKQAKRRKYLVGGAVAAVVMAFGLGITAGSDNTEALESTKKELSQVQEKAESLQEQVEGLKNDLAGKDEKISGLEGQLDDANGQISSMEEQVKAAEAEAQEQAQAQEPSGGSDDMETLSIELAWGEMTDSQQDDVCFAWGNMKDYVISEFVSNGFSKGSVTEFFNETC